MTDEEDLRDEIPTFAYISLARRGMEKISLDQCFLKNCDNSEPKLLVPFNKEEIETDKEQVRKIYIKCKKCGGTFILKLKTLKQIAKSTKDSNANLDTCSNVSFEKSSFFDIFNCY